MSKILMARIDERTLGKLNDLQERIEARNPGVKVPREPMIRELLNRAMQAPAVVRAFELDARKRTRTPVR